jgi:cell division septum initiation protein DivIVA
MDTRTAVGTVFPERDRWEVGGSVPDRRPTFDIVATGYHPGQVDRFVDAVIEGSVGVGLDRAAHSRAADLITRAEADAAEILESARYLKELATQEVEHLVRQVHAIAKREAARILEEARAEAARVATGARRSIAPSPSAGLPDAAGPRLPTERAGRPGQVALIDQDASVEDLVLDALMRGRQSGGPKLGPQDGDTIHRHLAG